MPTIVDTYIKDGETINVYESGAHYNVTRKHLVKAPDYALITPEKSAKYKEEMAERKREALVRGAGRALEKSQPGEWAVPNALDVVEALGEAVMIKALNPDNAKQVDAARFILHEAGIAESQTKPNMDAQQFTITIAGDALALLVDFLRAEHRSDKAPANVIDGQISDISEAYPVDTDTRNDNDG